MLLEHETSDIVIRTSLTRRHNVTLHSILNFSSDFKTSKGLLFPLSDYHVLYIKMTEKECSSELELNR